jgi:quercetin dioxygenase-like cupin family protein
VSFLIQVKENRAWRSYNGEQRDAFNLPTGGAAMMEKKSLAETRVFDSRSMKRMLLHDSPWFRILNFNLSAGQVFPVHSHDTEGQLSIQVLEGTGEFLGKDEQAIPAQAGDLLLCDISEPHGVRAHTDLRILVTIAPPF